MPRIIVLAGLPGSGKTTASEYLISQGFTLIRMGDLTDEYLKKNNFSQTEKNENKWRIFLREKYGENVYAEEVIKRIKKLPKIQRKKIVIEGLRSVKEYEYFKNNLKEFILVFIEADRRLREKRLIERTERSLEKQEIKKRDDYEKSIGVLKLKDIAYVKIQNNKHKKHLYKKIDNVINN